MSHKMRQNSEPTPRKRGAKRRDVDDLIVLHLAMGDTQEETATACGVTRKTVQRRMAEPGFREAVQARRSEFLDEAIGRLSYYAKGATETLQALSGENEESKIRTQAAKTILDHLPKLRQLGEFDARLTSLEKLAAERGT